MKLIDLLVQELPKRGGWPEGAVGVVQDKDDTGFYFFIGSAPKFDGKSWWFGDSNPENQWFFHDYKNSLASDYATAIVTREQYEATGWDGVGLPPIGVECERSWCGDKWLTCKILFISDETVVIKLATREAAYGRSEVSFRPLRTEAERAIDEMVELSGISVGAAKILYDAGYRKA